MLNAKKVLEIAQNGYENYLPDCFEEIIELCEKEIAEASIKLARIFHRCVLRVE